MAVNDIIDKLDENGEPLDKTYLEAGLPAWLNHSIEQLKHCSSRLNIDLYQDNLYNDINWAVIGNEISESCAKYLREKYLARDYIPESLK